MITKNEMEKLLQSLGIPSNEGITHLDENDIHPRIVYFEYLWEDIVSSGELYDSIVAYQISFKSLVPRDPKLIELKSQLNKLGYHPQITHEYIKDIREWHSYFSLDVLEDVCK